MEPKKIERINELARKAKKMELTAQEKAEQKELRSEYIAEFRQSLKAQLDNTVVLRPDGTTHQLGQKSEKDKS